MADINIYQYQSDSEGEGSVILFETPSPPWGLAHPGVQEPTALGPSQVLQGTSKDKDQVGDDVGREIYRGIKQEAEDKIHKRKMCTKKLEDDADCGLRKGVERLPEKVIDKNDSRQREGATGGNGELDVLSKIYGNETKLYDELKSKRMRTKKARLEDNVKGFELTLEKLKQLKGDQIKEWDELYKRRLESIDGLLKRLERTQRGQDKNITMASGMMGSISRTTSAFTKKVLEIERETVSTTEALSQAMVSLNAGNEHGNEIQKTLMNLKTKCLKEDEELQIAAIKSAFKSTHKLLSQI